MGQVEVLNCHAVNLPERVAGLPKELESRESPIPYDYDLSIEDPQDRVCVSLSVCLLYELALACNCLLHDSLERCVIHPTRPR